MNATTKDHRQPQLTPHEFTTRPAISTIPPRDEDEKKDTVPPLTRWGGEVGRLRTFVRSAVIALEQVTTGLGEAQKVLTDMSSQMTVADVAADVWRDVATAMETGPHQKSVSEKFIGRMPWYRALPSFAFALLVVALLLADVLAFPFDVATAPLAYAEQRILPCLEPYRCDPDGLAKAVSLALRPASALLSSSSRYSGRTPFRCTLTPARLAAWNQSWSPATGPSSTAQTMLVWTADNRSAIAIVAANGSAEFDFPSPAFVDGDTTAGDSFSYEPALLQFMSLSSFQRLPGFAPVPLRVATQIAFTWDASVTAEQCATGNATSDATRRLAMQWPPAFHHSVSLLGGTSVRAWLLLVAAVWLFAAVCFGVSLLFRQIFEFAEILQRPAATEHTRDVAFGVLQFLILCNMLVFLMYGWLGNGGLGIPAPYAKDDWRSVTHLRRLRVFLRIEKVLCAIPAMNFSRFLPTRGWFYFVNLLSVALLLIYFHAMSYVVSLAPQDATHDLRSASNAGALSWSTVTDILTRAFTSGAMLEPIAMLASFGIVASVTPELNVYIRQCYFNQQHTYTEHFARRQTWRHVSSIVSDRQRHTYLFYRMPFRQLGILNVMAGGIVMLLYAAVVAVMTYSVHLGIRDPDDQGLPLTSLFF